MKCNIHALHFVRYTSFTHLMNRRKFMKGASLAGFIAFLQACNWAPFRPDDVAQNLSTSIPTATPSPIPPTATPTSSPTITPTSTPSATSTITPTPTETPIQPTPTPTTTPYPPGPPSKLGLFITRYDPKVLEIVTRGQPALVKTMELDGRFVNDIKRSSPKTTVVGRIVVGQLNLDVDPLPLAKQFVETLLPIATDPLRLTGIDAWEAYNEPVADTPDKMKRLADFEAERTRLLAEHGLRSVVGNFGTGHPPLDLWPDFEPALAAIQQHDGYLGLHEYSAPVIQFRSGGLQFEGEADQGDEGWLTLRYRKAYRQYLQPMGYGDVKILMTECGVDGLVRPRPGPEEAEGWQDFVAMWEANGLRKDPPGVYMDQLIWYDENLQQDDYVKGAAIFLAGSNDSQWDSYDILGPNAGRLGDLLLQYLAVHPPA